jgi:hypothetical protein
MKLFVLTALMAVDWGAPRRRLLDFCLAGLSLALGMFLGNAWIILGGLLGLGVAFVNPMRHLQARLAPRRIPPPARTPNHPRGRA